MLEKHYQGPFLRGWCVYILHAAYFTNDQILANFMKYLALVFNRGGGGGACLLDCIIRSKKIRATFVKFSQPVELNQPAAKQNS